MAPTRWAALPVLVHQDWCSRNVRVVDGAVVAVYDWDSVQRAPIARAAGQAAALWPCTSEDGSPDPSTPDELDAFLADFAVAWGTPFTAADRRVAHASAGLHARLHGAVRARDRAPRGSGQRGSCGWVDSAAVAAAGETP